MSRAKPKTQERPKPRVRPAIPPLPGCVDPALDRKQVAATIGASVRHLTTMRAQKRFPPPDYKIEGSPRWLASTVRDWQQRMKESCNGVGEEEADGQGAG